ncbi:hypothetical protein E2562_032889 [Oryza meyeriana var. granulata]|uniref:KIB1-4 beta-propeller domain-containing protein n=1 Tax=Oryza meyeriana var. granulata TaxID=110450 RepID=A0A6G1F0M9_9ORYZ|nr:hypothetical protein E2562_032889 [Oryza meyeriana var. granulata]
MPRGWLALTDDDKLPTRLVLWEPTSSVEIELPPLRSVLQVFLSGDPLSSPAPEHHWMALPARGTHRLSEDVLLASRDDSCSLVKPDSTYGIDSVAFHDGKVFFIYRLRLLVVYDLNIVGTTPLPAAAAS